MSKNNRISPNHGQAIENDQEANNEAAHSNEGSPLDYVTILSGPLLACISGGLVCLVPIHNVMEQPKYWYEDMTLRFLATIIMMMAHLVRAEYWSKLTLTNRAMSYLLLEALGLASYGCVIMGYYIFWTYYLGYSLPLPMNQHLGGAIGSVVVHIILWFRLPITLRSMPEYKKRYAWHFLQNFIVVFGVIGGYGIFISMFVKVPRENQWILALISPFVRDFSSKLVVGCVQKAAGPGSKANEWIKYPPMHFVVTKHAVSLAVIVGGVSTPESSYIIMAADFGKAMFSALMIIRNHRNGNNVEDAARKLVINERKSINALTYMIIVIMAYYGPNAELLGNIKLSIWQFQKPIFDIQAYLFNVFLLLIVDIFSFAITGVILWQFCQINVVKILKKLQHELWMVFAIAEGFLLMEVFITVCIGGGYDLTQAFDWRDGRFVLNETLV